MKITLIIICTFILITLFTFVSTISLKKVKRNNRNSYVNTPDLKTQTTNNEGSFRKKRNHFQGDETKLEHKLKKIHATSKHNQIEEPGKNEKQVSHFLTELYEYHNEDFIGQEEEKFEKSNFLKKIEKFKQLSTEQKEKIKIKHHHHHHHHNHIKTVIKKVPEPYPIEKIIHVPHEKIVHVPVEKIVHVPVEKIVRVPKPYPVENVVEKVVHVPVEKIVHVPKPYPVEKIIEKPVKIEKKIPVEVKVPVKVKVPYPVEKIVHVPIEKVIEKLIHIPRPFPVEKVVEKIVHLPRPYPVVKTIPFPVEVKIPVHIPKPITIPIEKKIRSHNKNYTSSETKVNQLEVLRNFPSFLTMVDQNHSQSTNHFKQINSNPFKMQLQKNASKFSYKEYNIPFKFEQPPPLQVPFFQRQNATENNLVRVVKDVTDINKKVENERIEIEIPEQMSQSEVTIQHEPLQPLFHAYPIQFVHFQPNNF